MRFSAPVVSIVLGLLSACGPAGADGSGASAAGFRALTASPHQGEWVEGGLRVEISNRLPKVEVPEPHLPTVAHINAKVCSHPPFNFDRVVVTEDGNRITTSAKGRSKCVALSPTIYAETTQEFVLSPSAVQELVNEDYTRLELSMKDSTQYTRQFYSCWPIGDGSIHYQPDLKNELKANVSKTSSLFYGCR